MDSLLSPTEYRLLVEHAPVMVWRSGLDAKCDYFNETWLAFTGRTMEQEMGDGWAEGVHPDDLQRCVAFYLDHFARRQPFEMEYRLRRMDGTFRWIFDRGVPCTDDTGAFAGFIGSCVDIDERRRVREAQQRHDREQLELARDFEKWILAIVSHNIRDPLNAIQLAAHGGRGEGLGLGLFIAKAIAIAHGGGLEVDSAEGRTTFRLVLPRNTQAGQVALAA